MDINFLKILFYVLCFQFLFVSFFLFQSKKGKPLSNKILAVVFLMISVAVLNLYLLIFRVEISKPQLLLIDDTFMFAYGPLLYLFTQSVIYKDYILKKNQTLHFIPFLISVCLVIGIILFVKTESVFQVTNQFKSQHIPFKIRIVEFIILGHIFYYLIKSKLEINKFIDKVMNIYSSFNQDNFKLLKYMLNSFIILFSLSLIHSILPFIGIKGGLLITLILMILFMFYFVNSILLKLLNQSTNERGLLTQVNLKKKERYVGSKLSESELKVYKTKLWNHMIDNERFLDSELNINDLSSKLEISPKILSQVINEGYSCNFFDFVNKFRVEAAKSLFKSQVDNKLTIQEVMYDSGFNSKSSFNTAFKKFTKLTPTQFKNAL